MPIFFNAKKLLTKIYTNIMSYLLLFVLLIVIAILLYTYRRQILSVFGSGSGSLLYDNLTGVARSYKREKLRDHRRQNQWEGYEKYQDSQGQKLLNSKWDVVNKDGKTVINVSGEANGYIELLDWPNTDSWMFKPSAAGVLGSYCLDMTKEFDDKIISRINTYMIAARSL
jgi:hypothetical protein